MEAGRGEVRRGPFDVCEGPHQCVEAGLVSAAQDTAGHRRLTLHSARLIVSLSGRVDCFSQPWRTSILPASQAPVLIGPQLLHLTGRPALRPARGGLLMRRRTHTDWPCSLLLWKVLLGPQLVSLLYFHSLHGTPLPCPLHS